MNRTMLRVFVIGDRHRCGILGLAACATTGVAQEPCRPGRAPRTWRKRFVDSINRKDLDGTMACIWNSPELIWVNFGTVVWGYDGFRNGMGADVRRRTTRSRSRSPTSPTCRSAT